MAEEIPLIGFYLRRRSAARSRRRLLARFAAIGKSSHHVAPFNRYRTLDVIRGVVAAVPKAWCLYTGNDDHIVLDLVTPFAAMRHGAR